MPTPSNVRREHAVVPKGRGPRPLAVTPVRTGGPPLPFLSIVSAMTTTFDEGAAELTEMASRRDMICNQDTAHCPIRSGPGGGTALSENKPQTFHPRSPLSWRSRARYKTSRCCSVGPPVRIPPSSPSFLHPSSFLSFFESN